MVRSADVASHLAEQGETEMVHRRSLPILLSMALAVVVATPALTVAGAPSTAGGADRPGLRHDVGVIRDYYRDHPDEREEYGGMFLRERQVWQLVVLVTSDPPARPYAWEKDIRHPDQLRFRSVEFSLSFLKLQMWRISDARVNDRPLVEGIFGYGIDERRNEIFLATRDGRAPRGFWKYYRPRRAFNFQQGGPDQPT